MKLGHVLNLYAAIAGSLLFSTHTAVLGEEMKGVSAVDNALAGTEDVGWSAGGALDFGLESNIRADSNLPLLTAEASEEVKVRTAKTARCATFEQDIHADLGDVLRAGCQPTTAQMKKLMDNPVGNVALWMNQFDVYKMTNPALGTKAQKSAYTGILQFPKSISEDWNLINRIIYSVSSMPLDQDKIDAGWGGAPGSILPPPGGIPPIDVFGGRTTGFGDMYYVGFFSPKEGIKHEGGGTSVWGAGFDLGIPTASENILGTGKWTGGPSFLYGYLGPKWTLAALGMHYWDFAGDEDRAPVNLTNIQYFHYYALDSTTSIGAGPTIIANWEQDSENRWTVPVGIGYNKTINIGKVPVRFGIEAHYSLVQPDNLPGPKWQFRFSVTPAAPAALFEWMQ